MIGLPDAVRILLFAQATDMRKGFDGLSGLVMASGHDVYSGHLFVFLSRRRDRAKILTFQKGGFVLWYKRLERGRFKPVSAHGSMDHVMLDATELSLLLDGIDVSRVKRPVYWQPKHSKSSKGIDNECAT